ncbi:MAG TPA: hypothetical protein VGN57_01355 [Pirellulaceae bacterium]|jgi:hypothetical protein|nr:hypothetical protein [Pirellulaceae bacterium]
MNDAKRAIGYRSHLSHEALEGEYERLARHANLQLSALGLPSTFEEDDPELADIAGSLVQNYRQQLDLLTDERCAVDQRIEGFLASYMADLELAEPLRLPDRTLILDRHGMARALSLPVDRDDYENEWLQSYRVKNGVLHNPRSDRRTTVGTFHIAEGGLPIPGDKKAVPKGVFARLFEAALHPTHDSLRLPFTANRDSQAETFVSLFLRPLVRPEVPGVEPERTMEIRFFAPGALVSNLDFVESIFGNAGDPWLPENDAALDVERWTGHTGCVILAPNLLKLTKKELGLPHASEASERQRRDGMCWTDEGEFYNEGQAFKLSCRDASGTVITLIADNYYGYCKKEVKTQISFAANLMGNAEEEHAGGAVAFAGYSLGDQFQADSRAYNGRTFEDVVRDYSSFIEVQPEGYGTDRRYSDLVYIPGNAFATLRGQCITWEHQGEQRKIPLQPGKVYMTPSGYKLRMEKHPEAPSWRLIGTVAEGVFCHKPCTVSGGGKSEISKSIADYMHYGPVFVSDADRDLAHVKRLMDFDYSKRWKASAAGSRDYRIGASRKLLDSARSLGSVIKLLTPSSDYTDEYNAMLRSVPDEIKALIFVIKRFQEPGWEENWHEQFGVDIINGEPGHELKFRDRKLIGSYLRVGYLKTTTWRTFKLRQDFAAAFKLQTEDDITASTVVPRALLGDVGPVAVSSGVDGDCLKLAVNCEYRLFQRPDEAIHRGFDKQAEADLAGGDNFVSNFEPLSKDDVREMLLLVADFDAFSEPMQRLLREMADDPSANFVVCSANPRQVDGKPSKNPRYLQNRPDLVRPFDYYVAETGMRLHRALPADAPVVAPVNAVLMGRRNNPPEPDKGIKELAVYSPVHYQELPELFMDLIASLTGKSPSTTGFGSEGALTKSPFNCLRVAADLNTALVSYLLTGLAGFSTPAGHIGPNVRVDHDISLLIPEVWCRISPKERDPAFLIREGYLEPLQDVQRGETIVPVSRLGYRITERFVQRFFGRIFDNPDKVFDQAMLRPETQDEEAFLDGVSYIAESQRAVAQGLIDDDTIEELCPPLAALVRVMAEGSWNGLDASSPEFRALFEREAMLKSDWYRERLVAYRDRALERCRKIEERLEATRRRYAERYLRPPVDLDARQAAIERQKATLNAPDFLDRSVGTLGADPLGRSTNQVGSKQLQASGTAGV